MRFLTRIIQMSLAVALTLAVVLWFAARRGDRGFIEEEVTIARPAPAVFHWISSEDLVRRWVSEIVELRRADGGGALQKMTGFKMTQIIAGHSVEMTLRLDRVVPNQELSLLISSGDAANGFSGDAHFKLISSEEYTRLLFTSHTQYFGWSDRIFEPALTFATQRKMHDDLARLKLLMESEQDRPAHPRATSLGRMTG
jgi:uncharacterized protein YndB with AHSA1/START domain